MTLKEKFDKVMEYPFSEYREQMKVLKEENSIKYEQIADEFAIGFAYWCEWRNDRAFKTYDELLEIYKKEKEL